VKELVFNQYVWIAQTTRDKLLEKQQQQNKIQRKLTELQKENGKLNETVDNLKISVQKREQINEIRGSINCCFVFVDLLWFSRNFVFTKI